ncbi:MAG: class I SAM-dependent methyltransferase [Candidatus Sericytochromatia bacterium]|nr:class I SAM-dependent methyltransferase [Candidatus Sericytochromatia bacterium]
MTGRHGGFLDETARAAEAGRIAEAYAARVGLEGLYADDAPDQRLRTAERTALLAAGLAQRGLGPGRRVLEIGCGTGRELARFVESGWSEADLAGVDLLGDRVAEARLRLPGADLRIGDAAALPWEDGCFAVVGQWTVMSSVLDDRMRAAILAEAWRVLEPGGWLVSYDMRRVRPDRPLRPWTAAMLRTLLPEACEMEGHRLSLLPPLARRVARWPGLHDALARVPFLQGHELVWARKPERS